tara:strand:+ start:146 stop:523 length:378 start_codon:yes stop_codon:yes gene_type:complete
MSIKFIEEFDNASKKTAPGSKGIAFINILIVISCIIAVPFTFGTSLFGLLAVPIYAALQSIANETYRTRLFTEIQTQIIAEKEGLFNPRNNPIRRRVRSAPVNEGEPIDETDDIDEDNLDDDIDK